MEQRSSTSTRWQVTRAPAPPEGQHYQALRSGIETGDLLLFRGKYFLSGVIEHLSHSPYSHVAVLARWGDRVLAFQSDSRGVEVLPASRLVCRYNGRVDWWALKTEWRHPDVFHADTLIHTALTLLGTKFAIWPLLWLGVRIFFGRALNPVDAKATPDSLFCSQFVSECYRSASKDERLDPNPRANDASTSPGDFARSGFFEPRYQLYDGSGGKAAMRLLEPAPGPSPSWRSSRCRVLTWTGQHSIDPRLLVPPGGAPPPAP